MDKVYQAIDQNQAESSQLDLFRERLPERPYCTNSVHYGLGISYAKKALRSRYIQFNGPTHKFWLVFDIDRDGNTSEFFDAMFDWSDRNCPPPNIAVINPENRHGHLIYGLEIPIRTAPDGKPEPLRYAAAVEAALCEALGADLAYAGLICKNPLHSDWDVHVWEDNLYTLGDLEGWLDLSPYADRRKNLPAYGLGRNCTLFNYLSQWAYRAIRQGWPAYDRWFEAVLTRAEGYNLQQFGSAPAGALPHGEVKATAKSVARYTHRRFSPEGFSAWQAVQGAKGGKAKGKALREQLLPAVVELLEAGFSQADIAREVGQSRQTVSNWIKALKSGSEKKLSK